MGNYGMSLRERLEALPFVKKNKDGTLFFWSPPPEIERTSRAFSVGRSYAAMWAQVMRSTGNAGLLYHLMRACRGPEEKRSKVREGLLYEFGLTVQAAPENASTAAVFTKSYTFSSVYPRKAVEQLPWVRKGRCGLEVVTQIPNEDFSVDRARGRYYGGVLCEFIRQTGWSNFLDAKLSTPDLDSEVTVGMFHVLGEAIIASPTSSTVYQITPSGGVPADDGREVFDSLPDFA